MPERAHKSRLLAIPCRERLERVLRYLLDEGEFLSPYGIRSLSRAHGERPYRLDLDGSTNTECDYAPGESDTASSAATRTGADRSGSRSTSCSSRRFERYHHFYGDDLLVEIPTGSGRMVTLGEVAREISLRLASLFLPDAGGRRPCHGEIARYRERSSLEGSPALP